MVLGEVINRPILIASSVLVLAVSIPAHYLSSCFALGFTATGLLGLIDVFVIATIFALVPFGFWKKDRLIIVLGVCGLIVISGIWSYFGRMSERLRGETLAQSNRITVALNEYKASEGNYPDHLSGLLPTYMQSIPAPAIKNSRFFYEKEGETYSLGFFANAWMIGNRGPASEWSFDD